MSSRLEPTFHNGEQEHEVNVTILYDDFGSRWAREVIFLLCRSQPDDLHYRFLRWHLEFLGDLDLTNVAIAEAAGTQFLILSVSPGNITPRVENWFRAWMRDKSGSDATVFVLAYGTKEKSSAKSDIAFLEHAVTKAGINFFFVLPPHQDSLQCVSPTPRPQFSSRRPYRHWGLNE